jgi:SulP family sulfate permease
VLVAMALFVRRVAHLTSVTRLDASDADDQRVYAVEGELFFASSNDLVHQFDCAGDPKNIVIDMTAAHIWDASTVATLDAITTRYEARGKTVTIVGMDDDSAARHGRLAGRLGADH